jgi:hypothetical protein
MQRFAVVAFATCAIVAAALPNRSGRADEQMIPLAASGDWVAVEHATSITAAPDLCLAMTIDGAKTFALRASTDDIEVRYADQSWSLPAGVSGTLIIEVGSYSATLDISDNTSSMVMATVTPDQLQVLVSAMDKASSMTITAGNASPTTVSLNGSNTATTAFLTCAGITAPGEGGGGNPFQ